MRCSIFLFICLGLIACNNAEYGKDLPLVGGKPGDPLPGLQPRELARFSQGEAIFNKIFSPAEGLGPLFNENQCSACHTSPAIGGTGDQLVTKATRFSAASGCNLLTEFGGENIRTSATPLAEADGIFRETVPDSATNIARFVVPFLFGLGMVEAVSDSTLQALADPDDRDGDGISGRLARTPDGRVGRFGRKGDFASIADFNAGAFFLEMGISSPRFTGPETINGQPLPDGVDPTPDPEVDEEVLNLVDDFVRYLVPLNRRMPADTDAQAFVEQGETVFSSVGCGSCHLPVLHTGEHAITAMSRKAVAFYSDFLLHDLGPEHAGVCGPDATPTEYRTGILMGLGLRERYLHNGEAFSMEDAILQHGGEAERVREAFLALSTVDRFFLLRFLETL